MFPSFTLSFLILYVLLNFYLSLKIYKKTRRYFQPIEVVNTDSKTNMINIHDKYSEFSRKDNISFIRLFVGMTLLFWTRLIIILTLALSYYTILRIFTKGSRKVNQTIRDKIKQYSAIHGWLGLLAFGIRKTEIKPNVIELYKKYLGEDYDIEETSFSCIVTNHISWYEIIYLIYEEAAGFIAKQSIKGIPIVGLIADKLDSLFLDRTNEKDRNFIVHKLLKLGKSNYSKARGLY
jgi:1-acyl-sn-glycerol-3-phosphate acyltransferase